MIFLDKTEIMEELEVKFNAEMSNILEEVSKGLFKKEQVQESDGFRIFNWKTETYLNESIYETKEAAQVVINEQENVSDFLVAETETNVE